jgi:hypothetical protein
MITELPLQLRRAAAAAQREGFEFQEKAPLFVS